MRPERAHEPFEQVGTGVEFVVANDVGVVTDRLLGYRVKQRIAFAAAAQEIGPGQVGVAGVDVDDGIAGGPRQRGFTIDYRLVGGHSADRDRFPLAFRAEHVHLLQQRRLAVIVVQQRERYFRPVLGRG